MPFIVLVDRVQEAEKEVSQMLLKSIGNYFFPNSICPMITDLYFYLFLKHSSVNKRAGVRFGPANREFCRVTMTYDF